MGFYLQTYTRFNEKAFSVPDGVDLADEFVGIDADEIRSASGLGGHDALEAELNSFLSVIDLEWIFQFVGWLIQ